jgi:hypothetical protein
VADDDFLIQRPRLPEPTEKRPHNWQIGLGVAALVLSLGASLAAGFSAYYTYRQAYEAHEARIDANKASAAQAADVERSRRAAEKSATAAEKLASEVSTSNLQAKAGLEASTKQSRDSLGASIAASRLDQRAWVSVTNCELVKEPDAGEGFTVRCHIQNTGKTPALFLIHSGEIDVSNMELKIPDWTKMPRSPAAVLFPGDTQKSYDELFPANTEINKRALDFYRSKAEEIWVRVHITYADVFGRNHYTDSCYHHIFGSGLGLFGACQHRIRRGPQSDERLNTTC